MAIIKISYNCGCGFSGNTVEEAGDHVNATGHTLNNICGSIAPSHARVKPVKTPVRDLRKDLPDYNNYQQKKKQSPGAQMAERRDIQRHEQFTAQPTRVTDFSSLRQRLGK